MDRGFSLIEVVLAVFLTGIIAAGASSFWGRQFREQGWQNLRGVRDRLAAVVGASLGTPESLFHSVAQSPNSVLSACVMGTEFDCGTAAIPLSFGLYDVAGQALSVDDVADVGGCYDREGNDVTDDCMFRVETRFWGRCQGSSCPSVTQLLLTYEVTYQGAGRSMRPASGRQVLGVREILGSLLNNDCGPDVVAGAPAGIGTYGTLIGYDAQGAPLCKCLYPYKFRETYVDPGSGLTFNRCERMSPAELACVGGYLRGMQHEFVDEREEYRINCLGSSDTLDNCEDRLVGVDGLTEACPAGSWLQSLKVSSCRYSCVYPLGSSGTSANFGEARTCSSGANADLDCPLTATCCRPMVAP